MPPLWCVQSFSSTVLVITMFYSAWERDLLSSIFGSYRSELRSDAIIGSQYAADTEYYHPFTPTGNWFVAPRGGANSTQQYVYNNNTWLATYRNRQVLGGLDVGYGFGTTGELRVGYEGGYEKLSPQIGNSSVLPTVSGGTGDVRLQYQLNTLDNPVIPRSGQSILLYTKGYNLNPAAPGPFPLSEVQTQSFFRLSDPSSVFLGVSGGSSYGYKAGIPAFSLGGSQRLVAWNTGRAVRKSILLRTTRNYPRTLEAAAAPG